MSMTTNIYEQQPLCDIVRYERQPSSNYAVLRKAYRGIHPILFVIASTRIARAKYWAKKLHAQFHVSTLALKVIDDTTIDNYLQDLSVQSVVIFQLENTDEAVHISSSQQHLIQFLSHYTLPSTMQLAADPYAVSYSRHRFVTQFTVGIVNNNALHQLLTFLLLFVPLHIRLCEGFTHQLSLRFTAGVTGSGAVQ